MPLELYGRHQWFDRRRKCLTSAPACARRGRRSKRTTRPFFPTLSAVFPLVHALRCSFKPSGASFSVALYCVNCQHVAKSFRLQAVCCPCITCSRSHPWQLNTCSRCQSGQALQTKLSQASLDMCMPRCWKVHSPELFQTAHAETLRSPFGLKRPAAKENKGFSTSLFSS
jgi:hypothetical protein